MGRDDGEGNLVLPPGDWLSLYQYLRALRRIEKEVGASVLLAAGQTVPKYAQFPPSIVDAYGALESMDIAYYMNHRKNGQALFNPASGTIEDDIGHYVYRGKKGDARVEIVSDTPYPCPYDNGIILGLAQRYQPKAKVTHGSECRSKDGEKCTYVVTLA
jgi:hypothetical protein